MRVIDLTGQRFGALTVECRGGNNSRGQTMWRCRCDCGRTYIAWSQHLRRGQVKSCGCAKPRLISEAITRHGCSRPGQVTVEYRTWTGMIKRCTNPCDHKFAYYGGRGIRVCDRWLGRTGFETFLADMGPRPSPRHSIDRIDNDGNYEPGNCRWATREEQRANRADVRIVRHPDGREMPLAEWARQTGLQIRTLRSRILRGWPIAEALATEVGRAPRLSADRDLAAQMPPGPEAA